jgi:nucleotide-binding universal stress UspA family protein
MFDRILVALDESEQSRGVVDAAIQLAQAMNAELRCCHVITAMELDFSTYLLALTNASSVLDASADKSVLQSYAKDRQDFEARQLTRLRSMTQDAVTAGMQVDHCLAHGDPGKQLCQMADQWKADTIVIGRRGCLGLKEVWLGSVSNYVLHHAACTVLVIQGEEATKPKPDTAMDLSHV